MGRYSSVQAYADNNANMRSIPYEQAVGSAQAKAGPGMLFSWINRLRYDYFVRESNS